MSEATESHPRDRRASMADGALFSAMVGTGETYVPAFALVAGLGDTGAALLATLPMLGGAIFQLVTPAATRRLGTYRGWVVACATLQALTFAPLIVTALSDDVSATWVVGATVAYWAFGMSASPAWNTWITTLIPERERAGFFARRTRVAQAALLFALLGAGYGLQAAPDHLESATFAAIFSVALVTRLASAASLACQGENTGVARRQHPLGPREVLVEIRRAHSGSVLVYLLALQFTAFIASPFFTPFMLNEIHLSYGWFMTLTAAAFLGRIIALPTLGKIAERRGARGVLIVGALGVVPLPALWMVSHAPLHLLAVQISAGVAWAAVELATTLVFFEGIGEEKRASVLTAFNVGNAVAMSLGSVLGAQLFGMFSSSDAAYWWLFILSSVGRLGVLGLLRRVEVADTVPTDVELRTLAVRPGGGAVQRPILATLSGDAPEAPSPRGVGGSGID